MHLISRWFARRFSDPQAIILATTLIIGFGSIIAFGDMLAPVLASVVLAYLLDSGAAAMERMKMPRVISVVTMYLLFLAGLMLILFALLPLLSTQVSQLLGQLPAMILKGQALLMQLPETYPDVFSRDQIVDLINSIQASIAGLGQQVVSLSITSVFGLIEIVVYLVLVPIMVFFMLKDRDRILSWFRNYLPKERQLVSRVWEEVDAQLGNYVRGKFWEILIVWVATYIGFAVFGLQFAMLLALAVGLSVIVPYVGMVLVTFPVIMVAFFQFGWTSEFGYCLLVYFIIQAIDGNVLVPLLFSEVVNLHPIAIIVAVLLFGGFWGMWGVFFAIPLATLVKAVLNAWPDSEPAEEATV
ncbi:MAG: AI-2E family transporter [Gammaproteobacteria bacterium]